MYKHNRPTQQTISNTVRKFEGAGWVIDNAKPVHHRKIHKYRYRCSKCRGKLEFVDSTTS